MYKRIFGFLAAMLICVSLVSAANVKNYFSPPSGGSKDNVLTIGGTENVSSGATLTIQSGGILAIAGTANVTGALNITTGVLTLTTAGVFNGGINFGSTSRTIDDGTYSITISTDTNLLGDITLEGGLKFVNSSSANLLVTDGTNTLFTITDAGSTGNATASGNITATGNLAATGKTLTLGSSQTVAYDSTNFRINISTDSALLGDITLEGGLIINNSTAANFLLKDGSSNTLFTIADAGSTGNATASGTMTASSFIIGANTLDTNEWAFLDGTNQALKITSLPTFNSLTLTYGLGASTGIFSGALTALTLDTGQGAYELYAMNQNVMTSNTVSFAGITNSGGKHNSGFAVEVDSFTITVASTTTHNLWYLNKASQGLLVTLPAASAASGAELTFKNIADTDTTFSQNIDGGAYTAVDEDNDAITIHSDGTNWNIVSRYEVP
jgi:hypothetical protein